MIFQMIHRDHPHHSIFCLPLVKQAAVISAIYVEKDLTSHAFSAKDRPILELIASQAASSCPPLFRDETYGSGLTEAQRLILTGHYCLQVSSQKIFWSEETYRIYDFDPATTATVDMVYERAHPDERELIRQFIEGAPHDGKQLDLEHRLLMPDGSIKTLRVFVQAIRDKFGEVTLAGTTIDITAFKKVQERLQISLNELRKLASLIENSGEFVECCTMAGQLTYLNPAGRRLVGLGPDEDVSIYHISKFYPPDDHQLFMQQTLPLLLRDGRWEGECILRPLEGSA
jgi:PAS domain-containing protein